MMDAETAKQSSLAAAATIRRAFASFNQETAEFNLAAGQASVDQMELARRRAHDHLDAYLDGIEAAYDLAREGGARS